MNETAPPKEIRSVEVEEVMARYTFGMTSRPRKHLVPLPRQQESKRESSKFIGSCVEQYEKGEHKCGEIEQATKKRNVVSIKSRILE